MQHRIRNILSPVLGYARPLWIVNLFLFICTGIIFFSLTFMFFSAASVTRQHAALIRTLHQTDRHIMLAHLWLEEALGGDTSVHITDVRNHLDQAEQALQAILESDQLLREPLVSSQDASLRKDLIAIQSIIRQYRELTEQRWANINKSSPGSPADQQFDGLFDSFLTHTDTLREALQQKIDTDLHLFRNIMMGLLGICAAAGLVTAGLVNYFLIYQYKTKQKLLAFNQQLQASEQHMNAANQQLTASEQQLRAANQQLRTSESQLKASNERLSETKERFRLLMQESPSVIEVYDRDGLQIDVNAAYEKLWGFPAEHTLGRFNILESEEIKRIGNRPYIERAYAGETVVLPEYEFDATGQTEGRGRGRKRWLFTRIYPIRNSSGAVQNIVVTHEDITARKHAELEREKTPASAAVTKR